MKIKSIVILFITVMVILLGAGCNNNGDIGEKQSRTGVQIIGDKWYFNDQIIKRQHSHHSALTGKESIMNAVENAVNW
jgi:hypothetical protein